MSTFKRPGQQTYSYDFRLGGRRYSGSTGTAEKRSADRIEAEIKKQARENQRDAHAPLTIAAASGRYWIEVGQHHVNADTTLTDLAWLERQLGKSKLVSEISSNDVAALIARRRLDNVAPATINRSVIQRLRAVLTRAGTVWGARVRRISWGALLLREPQERVRELSAAEEVALFAALREDYHPIVRFALLTGCRRAECCGLAWRHIDWRNRFLAVTGKGDRTRLIPMTDQIYKLLRPLPHSGDQVFTFESKRADFAPRKSRHPIQPEGLKRAFGTALTNAKIEGFRFHDLRHTAATRLLRATGNLRLVQQLLGHADIATTMKYAHTTLDDLRSAMTTTQIATAAAKATPKPPKSKKKRA